MNTETKVRWVHVVEVEANTGDTSGEAFLERATKELSVSGGQSWSDSVVNDMGEVSISFNPQTAEGGPAAVLRWLDSLDIEYTARFMRWSDDEFVR